MRCPKCNREYKRLLAISRDTRVPICSDCATEEALRVAVSNGAIHSTQADEIMKIVRETETTKTNSN